MQSEWGQICEGGAETLPDLLARIADLEKRNAELEAWLGKEQEVKRDD